MVLQPLAVRVHDDGHDLLDRRRLDVRSRGDELEGPFAFEVGRDSVPEPKVRKHLLQRVERSPRMLFERRGVREIQPQDLMSQLPLPVARRQREILALDVQDKGTLPPAVQQRGQDQTDPLSAPRRGEAEDVLLSVVPQHQGFLQESADDDAAHDDTLIQRFFVFGEQSGRNDLLRRSPMRGPMQDLGGIAPPAPAEPRQKDGDETSARENQHSHPRHVPLRGGGVTEQESKPVHPPIKWVYRTTGNLQERGAERTVEVERPRDVLRGRLHGQTESDQKDPNRPEPPPRRGTSEGKCFAFDDAPRHQRRASLSFCRSCSVRSSDLVFTVDLPFL